MSPSLTSRPLSRDSRPISRGDDHLLIPNRTSSLHSRVQQPTGGQMQAPKTLTHAYMVCGVGREPSQWVRAPAPSQGKIAHMKGAVGGFWLPEILGSSPRLDNDAELARALHAAMRACFPHDVEICSGSSQPHCLHHAFVLQQDSAHTLYGIALRVWSRADEKRAETIRELRRRGDEADSSSGPFWIPYCLTFLSRYPLYNLLGDYLRGMWIHWNKATNLFHAEEVSRILSFPAPRLNDLVRIDMKDYALCYQFPSSPSAFQNFDLWPLFCCLSLPNLVGLLEAAVSPTRRIILLSHYPAMLTVAAETVRFLVRVYEWSGLYMPVVHARHAASLVEEPGPYMLGITSECRSLFTAPPDALVVDLDRNFVLTSSPPMAWSTKQRTKLMTRLTQALQGDVVPSGVPQHLRSAYGGGKLIPAGQIIVMRGEVERVQPPAWWRQDEVMQVMDAACEKLGKNSTIKALFGSSQKTPLVTKVSTRHLNEIVRERNQYSRDAADAWQDLVTLKGRLDTEVSKVTKRNQFLVDELDNWKQQFLKFQAFAEQLTAETGELKARIDQHKRENRRLTGLIEQHKDDAARLSLRLSGTEKQRDDALEALVLQQEIAQELERERKRNRKDLSALQHTNTKLLRQRDDAQRVVLHLRALIDGQAHHMEHIVKSIRPPEPSTVPGAFNSDQEDTIDRLLSANGRMDAADRHLRDKTDAIAYIIRNISEQCAAAVEGLDLARRAEASEKVSHATTPRRQMKTFSRSTSSESGSEYGDAQSDSATTYKSSLALPPTPDLVHDRSSTSMSVNSENAPTPKHQSLVHAVVQDGDAPQVPGVEEVEPVTKYSPRGLPARRVVT
ncbi:hypothetical protein K470DRAFT_276510 [Piedraia hortae CBS 480.64]|uniref:UDENN domain-containing protein n=1 Tax=Piedraia hortae CBS 480.64 TaxID=1314780 RepID=A0A6A7C135_9PEZI|nr:hypothetical protein K470DRAFT_276510 [Piedraia hortae CBS 480.64]